jgi:hypothetical protein
VAIAEVGKHSSGGWGSALADTHGLTIAANDVVIVTLNASWNSPVVTFSDNNGSTPFTSHHSRAAFDGYVRWQWWYRVAGSSEPSSYAFTSSANTDWSMMVRVFRGVDTDNIFDLTVSSAASDSGTSATATASTRTTNYAGSLAIATFVNKDVKTYSSPTNGFAEELEQSANTATQASYTKAIPSIGAIGATSVTLSGSVEWEARMYALRNKADATADLSALLARGFGIA